MEKVLVTGGTGFIGRALCRALVDAGHVVRATYIEDRRPESDRNDIEWVKTAPLGPDADWSAASRDITHIVHLAGLAHSAAEAATADELMAVNALGTQRLAEAAAASGTVQRFVFMSSVAAVVATNAGSIQESAIAKPASDYGRSKLAAEQAVRSVIGQAERDYVILRPTLVYGPGNPGNMQRLQKLVQIGAPLPLASLANRRSFCFLGNIVSALCTVMLHPGAANQDFTVCDDETLSTPELIRLIAKFSGKRALLFPVPPRFLAGLASLLDRVEVISKRTLPFDSDTWTRLSGSLVASNSKLRNCCEWKPPYSLQEGLRATLGTSEPGSQS
jgi:nucleoside-diphosphate-sugar epimerase